MKKIYKSITLVAAILSLSSCGNDWLDRKPADGIPSEDAITNYNDALTARTGMYDGIQGKLQCYQLLWCPYVLLRRCSC